MARNKRVFKRRSDNKKKEFFTFHSYGTHIKFEPFKPITDDRIVNEAGYFETMPQLDFYKAEVLATDAPHVYILDSDGNEINLRS